MFSIAFNRPLAAIAVVSGLLVGAAPAGAKVESPTDQSSGIHALHVAPGSDGIQRASVDGTSNTVMFAAVKDADGDEVLTYEPQSPRANGIIAILIGL